MQAKEPDANNFKLLQVIRVHDLIFSHLYNLSMNNNLLLKTNFTNFIWRLLVC
jgi:hypothetical protein